MPRLFGRRDDGDPNPRSNYDARRRRTVIASVVGVLAVIGIIAGAITWGAYNWSRVSASNAACVYNGGPLDNTNYKGFAAPGSGRQGQGFFSEIIEFPVGIRQYDATDGLAPINVSVGGFNQTYSPTLNFTLSTVKDDKGKPAVCTLIEQQLRPLDATDFDDDVQLDGNGGCGGNRWVCQFLNVRVQPAIRDALPRVLSNGSPSALFLNTPNTDKIGARDAAARQIGQVIGEVLNQQLGGTFFCEPGFRYGGTQENCGQINVVLPEPRMDDASLAIIRAPAEARTKADNDISVAQEAARAAKGVAQQRTEEALSAKERADADVKIATEQGRTDQATVANQYLWCEQLVALGQNCALVKAAENSNFPSVIGSDPSVLVTPPTTPGG